MTSSHTIKVLLALFIAILTVGYASAEIVIDKYDHHQYMDASQERTFVCSCASTTDYYTVTNHGDFAAMFTFSLEAEMDWVSMQATQAYLQPGETYRIAVDVSPPCGLEMDPPYTVYSSSQYGRFAVAHNYVTATVCETLQFDLQQNDHSILPCTDASFDLLVKNIGPYTETYTLSADERAVTISQEEIRLQAGESAAVPARAQWSCDVSGLKDIEFSAYAHSTQSTHQKTGTVRIVDDYEYSLSPYQVTQSVCEQVPSKQQILVRNIAETPNTYQLSHRGPSFASLSEEMVVLQPGQSKLIDINLEPAEGVAGQYTSTIRARSEYGGVDKSIDVNYNVRSCYGSEVTVSPQNQQFCAGFNDVLVRVENRGESTETFTLIPEGELFSEVQPQSATLRPSEHVDAVLNISVPDETAQRTVDLIIRQTPGIDKTVQIPVDGLSNAACTQMEVDVQKYTVYSDQEVLPVIIRNDGIRATNYELDMQSSIANLREDNIFLGPGEQGVLHVEMPELESVAKGQYVAQLRGVSDRSEYRMDLHITVKHKGWFSKAYDNIAFGAAGALNWCLLLALILFVLAIIVAVVVLLMKAGTLPSWMMNPSAATTAKAILAGLALLFVVFAVISMITAEVPKGYDEEFVGSNYSALYHEFGADEVYDMDLSAYFMDPDGDPLTYTHSQPENLRINVQDNVARISTRGSWSGTTSVVFTAQDPGGLTADSPIMTIRAVPQVPVTFWDWVSAYCSTLNWALLAIIALLLIAAIKSNPRGELVELEDGTIVPADAPAAVAASNVTPVTRRAPQSGSQVQGDVVAGDKVTINNAAPGEEFYVASKQGKKFHPMDSHFVERMPKKNRVIFRSKEEAVQAGYTPSKEVRR